jgi:very-short-patch-repair endonuclease
MRADKIISALAGGQHWAVARSQLIAGGVPGPVVDRRLHNGLLVPVHAGVYVVAGSERTWPQRIAAATLAAGPGAAASHRAAGFLHGLDGVEPRPEVTVRRGRAPRPAGVVVHRATTLPAADVEERDGIPRTPVAATLVGLAAVLSAPRLEAALDDALVRGLVSSSYLARRIEGGRRGQAGVATLRMLLEVRQGGRWTQSEFERRLFAVLAAAGVPLPVPQFEVVLPGGRRIYLDFAWPELLLAIEANSYRHHASRRDWSRDHVRNNAAIALGWRILPVTWTELVESPDLLVALLRQARAA